MEPTGNPNAVYLKRLVDATLEWHLIFASDRIRSQLDPLVARDLEIFVGEARMIRWAMTSTEEQLAEVWDNIVPGSIERDEDDQTPVKPINNNIVDYVLQGTAYIKAMVPIPSGHWNELISDLARSITWPYRATAISSNIKDRAASSEHIKMLFDQNPWTLFLFMLSIAPVAFDADSPPPLDFGPTSSNGESQ